MRVTTTLVLGAFICILSGVAIAATGNDVSPGQTPSFIADVFSRFDTAFTAKARASSASLIGYALRFLALSFTVMLVWRVLQWFLDAKPMASLIGTILNLMLHNAIVLVFLVPFGSSSGYQGTVAMVSSMADTVATAASGGAFTSGSAAITTGITAMLTSGFTSVNTLSNIAAARETAGTGLFSGLSIGSMLTGLMDRAALLIAGIAILIVTAYAGFQLAKVILYGVVMFALGTAVGPFFLGFLLLPPTRALGEHWFKFMLNAAFIKVVAFFMVGVIVGLGGALIPPITDVAALQNLGTFAILSSCLALILVYAMVGWVLGQSITMAGSLFGGSIGGFAPGLGLATLAAAAAGLATGGAAAVAAKIAGGKKEGSSESAPGTGSPGGDASAPASAAGNSSAPGAPASSQTSALGTSGAESQSSPSTSSGAGKAFVSGVASVMASGVVGAARATGAAVGGAAKVAGVLAGGTRTGSEMGKAFSRGAGAFGSSSGKSSNSTPQSPDKSSPGSQANSPEKQAYVNTAVAEAQALHADKSQGDRDRAVAQASKNAGSSFDAQQLAASNSSPAAVQGSVASGGAEQTTTSASGESVGDSNTSPLGLQGDSSSFSSGGADGTSGASQSAGERKISQQSENRISAARARADAVGEAIEQHKAATGATNADQSTRDAGMAGLAQHNASIGRTPYIERAVAKVDAGMAGYSQELRDQAAKETTESAAKKFDSYSPQVIERYNRAVESQKGQA